MDIINIVADQGERPSGIPKLIVDLDDVQLSIEHMTLGDYLVLSEVFLTLPLRN